MANVFQGITDAIGGILGSPVVQLGFRALAIYWVIFWLAASYWAFRDLQLRTENAVLPYLAAALIVVFTPLLFPAAIVIYRIIRPHERIDEVYERTLAQEAMLAEIEATGICPSCARRVRDDWIACPSCRSRLARPCTGCQRLVGLDWLLCGWCGQELAGRAAEPRAAERTPAAPVALPSVSMAVASDPARAARPRAEGSNRPGATPER